MSQSSSSENGSFQSQLIANKSFAKNKRMCYSAGFKLKVVFFAEQSNNCAASRQFGVSEKQVRDWRKMKASLETMPKSKKALRRGTASFPEIEQTLYDYITDIRKNGYIVTRAGIRLEAMKLLKKRNYANSSFRASSGWCTRFMKRYGLSLRQRTKIAQKLPSDLEEKIIQFQRFVIQKRKETPFELSQIGNMDETSVSFDLPANKTINQKGEKTVFIKTTGHEKTNFTVVLSCLADGSKLPPVIIFRRKTLPKNANFPSGVTVRAHQKGWMDETGTKDWLNNIWNKRPGALLRKPSLLVWDAFAAHRSDAIKQQAERMKTTLAVIPGGLTSMLQPLDVCLIKPFKCHVKKFWAEWISSDLTSQTKGGNLKKPEITLIAQWVKDAWNAIPSEMIRKSFKKCCISNELDGSEDDAIFISDTESETDSNAEETGDIYDDVQMTENEFIELFGVSDSESEFEGFQ